MSDWRLVLEHGDLETQQETDKLTAMHRRAHALGCTRTDGTNDTTTFHMPNATAAAQLLAVLVDEGEPWWTVGAAGD